MRVFFDTEFIEDGRTIDLISIGMVREDGATLYLESAECDLGRASPWVRENVLPHLRGGAHPCTRSFIARCVRDFCGEKPEFWAYYSDYDWIALCQLYGTMMQLPAGWPKFCLDLKQWVHVLGDGVKIELPEQVGAAHDALEDALWNAQVWEFLRGLQRQVDYMRVERAVTETLVEARRLLRSGEGGQLLREAERRHGT